MSATITTDERAAYAIAEDESSPDALRLSLAGDWLLRTKTPSADQIYDELRAKADGRPIVLDTSGLGAWDSGFVTFCSSSVG